MTAKEYKYRNYNERYEIDNYVCQKCGKPATQMAHRVAQTKTNIKKYGWTIIQHEYNIVSVCGLDCNSSYNIGNKPEQCKKLVKLIQERSGEKLTAEYIDNVLEA